MKKKVLIGKLAVFLIALLCVVSCDEDDDPKWNATSDPVLNLTSEAVHSDQGRTIIIKGTVMDELGIKSIHLNSDEWFLDKTIEIYKGDSLTINYDLNYKFIVPETAIDKENLISITITNVGNRKITSNVSVFMDGDFGLPILEVNTPADGLTVEPSVASNIDLSCKLSDDRQLGYLVVSEPSLNIYDSISFMGKGLKDYSYLKNVTIPTGVADYTFNFLLADSAGLIVSSSRVVKASYVYQKMYLADVATDAELVSDLFGVPMLINTIGENEFEANYYAVEANTEVKFIPQTSSFAPHCFGIDPTDQSRLIDSQSALPIVLPEVGYYKMIVDINSLTFSVEKYTLQDEPFQSNTNTEDDNKYIGELGIVGKGFPEYPDQQWSVQNTIIFDRDPNNLYLFTKTLDMEGTVEIVITPEHKSGWWISPSWHFDRAVDPEMTDPNSSINVHMEIPTRTKYTIIFDSHLNRMKAIKAN